MSEKYKDNSGNAYDPNLIDFRSEIASLNADLKAAKLREAEMVDKDIYNALNDCYIQATQERDAALSGLEIARTALQQAIDHMVKNGYGSPSFRDYLKQSITIAPSAALAERDREIEQRTAARCAEISDGIEYGPHAAEDIRREFGLEQKHPVTTD